ncbi:MAG: hypothetical protein PHU31_03375 [Anaerotignum sp.]|nr:hypothetical protein [Anaerotignum sp.]
MKKLKIILGCFVIVCICVAYYFSANYQRIQGLDTFFPESGVTAYVYSTGGISFKVGYSQVDPADYEALVQLIPKIKYMNPSINPNADEYIVYGGGHKEFEIIYKDTIRTFSISCNELKPNIRRISFSDGKDETSIAAYVKDDIYEEYERLAKKYIKDSENES